MLSPVPSIDIPRTLVLIVMIGVRRNRRENCEHHFAQILNWALMTLRRIHPGEVSYARGVPICFGSLGCDVSVHVYLHVSKEPQAVRYM